MCGFNPRFFDNKATDEKNVAKQTVATKTSDSTQANGVTPTNPTGQSNNDTTNNVVKIERRGFTCG